MIPLYRRGVEQVVKKSKDEFGKANWEIDYKIIDKQDQDELENPRHTKNLQARTETIDLQVGKTRLIVKEGPKKDQQGFYCELCDELATDSLSWLDHLNSPQHNRLLGMNMKVDRATVSQVQDKLKSLMPAKKEANKVAPISIDVLRKQIEEKEKLKKRKKVKKQSVEQPLDEQEQQLRQFLNIK